MVIRASEVSKAWAGQTVLQNLSLDLAAGEVLGLVGPNGSGKTTFLKCLLGLVKPDSGMIQVAGMNPARRARAVCEKTAYAPSETTLWPWMRASDLLEFCLGFHPEVDRDRGFALLKEFAVPKDRRVAKLSHGMKRKVLLAQAFACRCPLLLLDEPMEGLDPSAQIFVEELIRETAKSGVAVLFSSHDLAGVERMSDRVAFLKDGSVVPSERVESVLAELGRTIQVSFRNSVSAEQLPQKEGSSWRGSGREWAWTGAGKLESILPALGNLPIARIHQLGEHLDAVFHVLYRSEEAK